MQLTLLASLPLLDPHALDTQADAAVRSLMREGSSANTAASYRAAIRYWTAWFELRYGQPFALPLPRRRHPVRGGPRPALNRPRTEMGVAAGAGPGTGAPEGKRKIGRTQLEYLAATPVRALQGA